MIGMKKNQSTINEQGRSKGLPESNDLSTGVLQGVFSRTPLQYHSFSA
jgi:hypothetical protein